jgi:hypothetical protein
MPPIKKPTVPAKGAPKQPSAGSLPSFDPNAFAKLQKRTAADRAAQAAVPPPAAPKPKKSSALAANPAKLANRKSMLKELGM